MTARLLVFLLASLAPALARAEEAAHGEAHEGSLLWHAINLALIVGVIVYFARGAIRDFFATRKRDIEQSLERAAAVLDDAERRLGDWNQRMARVDAEIEEIRRTARERAEAEGRKILADATAAAERVRRDALLAVAQEERRAREALRQEASDLAIELAAGLIRDQVNEADRARLVDEFVEHVGGAGTRPAARS